jgi:hypothetical protein
MWKTHHECREISQGNHGLPNVLYVYGRVIPIESHVIHIDSHEIKSLLNQHENRDFSLDSHDIPIKSL